MIEEIIIPNEIKDSPTKVWQIIINKKTGAFINVNIVEVGQSSGSGNDITNFDSEAECRTAVDAIMGVDWWEPNMNPDYVAPEEYEPLP
ncbi:MAG: hypothetical protein JKY33_10590 [Bacteroidia bacterium]|nr:hypothetical protein [Bacteroidia bacterium]